MEAASEKWRSFLRNVRKKSCVEMILCLFLLVSITAYYCVDIFHILPHVYRLPSLRYLTHVLPLSFVVFNVLANFLAVVFVDSSVVGRLLTVSEYTTKGRWYAVSWLRFCDFLATILTLEFLPISHFVLKWVFNFFIFKQVINLIDLKICFL